MKVLDGKIAIVTGGASPIGLGRTMVTALLEAGARVAVFDTNDDQLADCVAQARAQWGDGYTVGVRVDVSSEASVWSGVDKAVQALGPVDIVVNNAGINVGSLGLDNDALPWEIPVSAWVRVSEVNYLGAVIMTNTVLPGMIARGYGRILGVTTSLDTMWRPISPGYGPSKAAHEAFVANVAPRLEGTGVTINVLTPGGVTMTASSKGTTLVDPADMLDASVMGAPSVWLASPASEQINGCRIIACRWDERLPLAERLDRAAAPAAWPGLGKQAVNLS